MNAETREALAREARLGWRSQMPIDPDWPTPEPSAWTRDLWLAVADAVAPIVDRLVADAERRGAERALREAAEAVRRNRPYREYFDVWLEDRADAQTPSKQGETDG